MEVSQEFIDSIIEKIYKKYCKVFRIIDQRGNFIAEFPVDINEAPLIDMKTILHNKWNIFETKKDPRKAEMISAVFGPFWTCNCKSRFVRHIGDPVCKKCDVHLNESKIRLPELSLKPQSHRIEYVSIH